ncbi:MAG: DUF2203 domain-containing protein [Armatimonadota bacterium]|nr:DUF2203 domain-containing protein [Armatimonadota bacterium]MDW8155818.1 DUF2203 domain-containing protein [Armatimonadota bacterium]
MRRFLSYEEASAHLPAVREAVLELRRLRERLVLLRAALEQAGPADRSRLEQQAEEILARMSEAVRRIEQAGGELKDLDLGLVDFLTLRAGQPAYYCWRLGEPEIRYWHGLDEGFAGRKPIDPDGWTGLPVA